jgi:ribonuclease R
MRDKVGETFNGVISGVAAFGIFIELTDIYTENRLRLKIDALTQLSLRLA